MVGHPRHRSGCSVVAGLILIVVILGVLGYYFIWRADNPLYAPGPVQACLDGKASLADCANQPPPPTVPPR